MMSNELPELSELSDAERELALKILNEFSTTGSSKIYDELLVSDYDEVPVDMDTFLHDKRYLGRGLVNEEGKFTVYPYWVDTLKKIFPDPLKPAAYNTLALTGAIGLGKSFVAVLVGLYELYRMLCLKDPYLYYGLQPIDKISFALMNITLDAAEGVAWDKFQQLAQSSEWFMSHGTVSKSANPQWTPGKKIELICGSQSRHIIGRAVFWCLDGDTQIATSLGDYRLSDLVDKRIQVYNINKLGLPELSEPCTVKLTAVETEEYQIELEDGTIIKCTPTHRFMLTDGSYKEAQHLTEEDEILDFVPFGYIYKITNKINSHFYIGKRECSHFDSKYWGSGKRIKAEIDKYGVDNFVREILCWARDKSELCSLEEKYINESYHVEECLNLKTTAEGGNTTANTVKITNGTDEKHISKSDVIPAGWYLGSKTRGRKKSDETKQRMRNSWTEERRKLHSIKTTGEGNSQYGNGEAHKGPRNGRYGKIVSEETRCKISVANKGRVHSSEINLKKGRPGKKKPEGFGEKIRQASIGTHWYNNGSMHRRYKDCDVPEGWKRGMLK